MWNLWREEKDEEEEEQKQKVEMQGWLDGEVNRWRAVLSWERSVNSAGRQQKCQTLHLSANTHIHMQAINAPDWLKIYSV